MRRGQARKGGDTMPREKELFYPTLERIRSTADRMFPDKIVYKQTESAKIMGVSVTTLWRKGLTGGEITCEQLARVFA